MEKDTFLVNVVCVGEKKLEVQESLVERKLMLQIINPKIKYGLF